jgi:DNA polymerase-4
MNRKIIHLDLDAFFCAVEEQKTPALAGKPFAVGGKPSERGVVASCSYAARVFGVRSAMPMARALRLCPELIIVSSRHGLYEEVSEKVMEHLRNLSPLIEQISIDEAFIDVTDLRDPPESLARKLQAEIRNDLGLPCSLGVATNKLVAKIANDVGKTARRSSGPPNAITIVPAGEEAAFLAPLPVEALWGVGPKTAERLAEMDILTIGDLAAKNEAEMMRRMGSLGLDMVLHARGIDDRPITTSHEVKSISQENTFSRDVRDQAVLERTLAQLSEGVGRRLRQSTLSGNTIKIKLRWPDFTTLTRQTSLLHPTDQDSEIYGAALSLFHAVWKPGKAVRLLGVGVSGVGAKPRQLSFWDQPAHKERRLLEVVDALQQRYGSQVLRRGRDLDNRE